MTAISELTSKAIKGMFCSAMVDRTIILQVLNSTKVQHRGLECCSVVLSDGLHMSSCFIVPNIPTKYERIENYTIIKVEHYYRSFTEAENARIEIILELDAIKIIRSGLQVLQRIGNPKPFYHNSNIKNAVILRTKCLAERAPLTKNAMERIIVGQNVKKPNVQILSAKLSTNKGGKNRLDLTVCDGQQVEKVLCSQPLIRQLTPQLHYLKMSIIQIDKYVLANGCIVIGEMTWLNWGSHMCVSRCLTPERITFPNRSSNGVHWLQPSIVQIVKVQAVKNESEQKTRKRLLLHNGSMYMLGYLSTQLEQCLQGVLLKNCIVRLDVYKLNSMSVWDYDYLLNWSSMTICGLTLLNAPSTADFQWDLKPARPTLTHGGVNSLINNDNKIKPVVKIVSVNFIFNGKTFKNYIRLLVYDGTKTCHAYLPSYMNYLLDCLEKLPIVRLDYYLPQEECMGNEHKLTVMAMTGLYLDDDNDMPNESG